MSNNSLSLYYSSQKFINKQKVFAKGGLISLGGEHKDWILFDSSKISLLRSGSVAFDRNSSHLTRTGYMNQ
jgi:hypothetical protein